MAYLTYDDYTAFGGTAVEDVFYKFEPDAEYYLNYFTLNRLSTSIISDDIKRCLTLFVDMLVDGAIVPSNVKTYSNGVESFSFNRDYKDYVKDNMYKVAKMILPVELISVYVGD